MNQTIANVLARCELPIMAVSSGLTDALTNGRQLVLTASPGAGKTTIVPLMVAQILANQAPKSAAKQETATTPGKIIVAQPRRVAVRSAATYVASLLGEKVGQTVGWRMRADTKVSTETLIEFTTTGTLLRRLLTEPDLPGVAAVILDEIHERHLDADLALAFALDVAAIRDDLRLIAMSATADAERFAQLITRSLEAPTPILSVTQPPHPLETIWMPPRQHPQDERGLTTDFLNHLTTITQTAFENHGATLVFVDTIANTERIAETLNARGIPAHALHSQISASLQDQILSAAKLRRVIVATEIAETSLTVPGVNCVVDSGFSRTPRFDASRQATHLVTVAASQSALTQRAGRSNRTGPGTVYRAYSETEYARAKAYATAEILAADLTEATLLAYAWSAPEQLALLDDFPTAAKERAQQNLLQIGALEMQAAKLAITAAGRILARIPADPRIAHGLLSAVAWGIPVAAAVRVIAGPDTPLQKRLEQLVNRFSGEYKQFLAPSEISIAAEEAENSIAAEDAAAVVWGAAYPQRLARANSQTAKAGVIRFTSVGGAGFEVEASTPLAAAKWIAAGEIQGINGVIKVRAGAALSEALALKLAQYSLRETSELALEKGRVQTYATRRLGALEIGRVKGIASANEVYELLAKELAGLTTQEWLKLFDASKEAQRFVAANNYLAQKDATYALIDGKRIAEDIDLFLGNSIETLRQGALLTTVDVLTGVKLVVGWQVATQIETLIPTHLQVPSGREVPVTIDPERGPTISVKLQECFGWRNVPKVLGKQISIELLSPAGRPLAVTGDLENFFNEVYASVRAQMRGRYPKHPWPEDPWEAVATAKTKRALGQ
ncbi:MAG: ATP-dependent helicase C-terminal domain-containing protein [Actinomycetaceae bacterium]|nr:ATP-dependent helicase C-terminal domain-containing protein [Actinomycetaceae bacterium]